MKIYDAINFINTRTFGPNVDDTRVIGRMLAEITEQLRAANLMKLIELELIEPDEKAELITQVRSAVSLPSEPTVESSKFEEYI